MFPIPLIDATNLTRRAVRGAGPSPAAAIAPAPRPVRPSTRPGRAQGRRSKGAAKISGYQSSGTASGSV